MKMIRICLIFLVLTLWVGADSQKSWSGSVGPMYTARLALGDGSASLSLSETAKRSNNSMAIGKFKLTKESLDIEVQEVRFSGSGAGKQGQSFSIETPRKGKDGVPALKLAAGSKVHFKVSQSGDRLELRGDNGVELNLHLDK